LRGIGGNPLFLKEERIEITKGGDVAGYAPAGKFSFPERIYIGVQGRNVFRIFFRAELGKPPQILTICRNRVSRKAFSTRQKLRNESAKAVTASADNGRAPPHPANDTINAELLDKSVT
jgi:hypothetical protein